MIEHSITIWTSAATSLRHRRSLGMSEVALRGGEEIDDVRVAGYLRRAATRYLARVSLINNPAGRLYLLLGLLRKCPGDMSIGAAWSLTLNVREDAVGTQLGRVSALVTQIDEAVAVNDRERIAATVNRYRPTWLKAVLPFQFGFGQQVANIKPSDESYESLGLVADILGAIAPDEAEPSDEEQERRLGELRALREDVREDQELPERVRHLIVDRLTAVELALEHINIGGAEGVQQALETLLGAAFATTVASERTAKSKIIRRVVGTAGVIWVVFTSGSPAQKSLAAWTGMFHELTDGPSQSQSTKATHAERDHEAESGADEVVTGFGEAPN